MNVLKETIAVDANPLLSALRGGKTRQALLSDRFVFITTEQTTWEVKKYIPEIALESGVAEIELFFAFDRFPIISVPSVAYREKLKQAENLIAHRDPKDVEILALVLSFNIPLWTNDKDFENLHEVKIFTTLSMLEKAGILVE